MVRIFFIVFLGYSIFGCTNLDERHIFNYKIEGNADHVDNIHVIMGPGIDWTANREISIPYDISHDIYGTELDYVFEAFNLDTNVDVTLKVFIDGELIEEKSDFSPFGETYRIGISGVFID